VLLRVLAEVAMQSGVTPAALFQAQANRFMACEPFDVRVPLSEYRALFSRAIALTGDPALGLRCALGSSESAFDLMAPLLAHVPTLRAAIREASQFQALAFDGAYLHFSEAAGVARLRLEFPRSSDPADRSIAEFLTAGVMRMLRAFGCARGELHAARFEHKRPSYHQAYAAAFQGAERFSEAFTGLEFAARLLDRPHIHCNPTLQNLVHAQAEQRLARLSRPAGLVNRLQMYLLNQPAACVPEMTAAARELGVSVRSLRRRLAEEGQSYRALTQEIQSERACSLLRNPDVTLQDVAHALGFTDAAAFHRAFKRWTGFTACEYRRSRATSASA
jgi:AraC-like DNA-binding protein